MPTSGVLLEDRNVSTCGRHQPFCEIRPVGGHNIAAGLCGELSCVRAPAGASWHLSSLVVAGFVFLFPRAPCGSFATQAEGQVCCRCSTRYCRGQRLLLCFLSLSRSLSAVVMSMTPVCTLPNGSQRRGEKISSETKHTNTARSGAAVLEGLKSYAAHSIPSRHRAHLE